MTKSGGKQFHGSLYEFFRNSALDATQYFNAGTPSPLRMNQFGGTPGGPVAAGEKNFFFVGYEGRRQRVAQRRFATVPDLPLLAGDFSGKAPIFDFLNNNAPFAGNVIPRGRMNRVASAFRSYVPAPNVSGVLGNYAGSPSASNDFDQVHGRLDHRFSDRSTIFVRVSVSDWREDNPGCCRCRAGAIRSKD